VPRSIAVTAKPPGRAPDRGEPAPARRERSRRKAEKQGVSGVVIGLICGGGVLLLALLVAVVMLLLNRGSDTSVAAAPGQQDPVQPVAAVKPIPVQQGGANGNQPAAQAQPQVAQANPAPAVPADQAPMPGDGGGALSFQMLDALKRATAFIKVESGDQLATGSGFLARVDGNMGFVVTNHHVIAPPPARIFIRRPPLPPRVFAGARQGFQKPTYTLVFNSGAADERSFPAEVAADDAKADLAVLRIAGLPPGASPIPIDAQAPLMETMSVFILGFPFGEMLATNKGNPAITVGKGSVSSIRKDNNGQLSMVQINGDLNPGNSGGPVVDARGRLVGIAVKTVVGTQIGLAIPAAKLPNLLATAPLQGAVAVLPNEAAPQNNPPRQGGALQPPRESQPLTEQELAQVMQQLASNNPALMNSALVRLGNAQPVDADRERVVKVIIPLTSKTQFGTDVWAVKALAVWATRDAVPTLLKTMKNANPLVRGDSMRALGRLKDERAIKPLAQQLIPFPDRMAASQALKEIGTPAEKAVLSLLKHQDVFVRLEACKVLEVIGTQASLAPLNVAVGDTNGLVSMAAQSALTAVQGRKQ
jgi:S1-C subfamily serine protease